MSKSFRAIASVMLLLFADAMLDMAEKLMPVADKLQPLLAVS